MTRHPSLRGRMRRGFGLIELSIAAVLLAAAMVATVQVVGWVAVERRAVERRERAVTEASNLVERLSARSRDDLETAKLASVRLSDSTNAFLVGGKLDVTVATNDGPPVRKKLTIEISWRDRSGRAEAPVRLATFVHRRGEPTR